MLLLRSLPPRSIRKFGLTASLTAMVLALLPGFPSSGRGVHAQSPSITFTPAPFPEPDPDKMPLDPEIEPVESPLMFEPNTTHRSITNVAIRRADCTADAYLKDQLRLTNGIFTSTPNGQLQARVEEGAVDEDSGSRPLNHFYDPISNGGLDDWASGANSMQWAYNGGGNTFDWQDARQSFYRSLTRPTKNQRLTEMAATFFSLGHVMHLVEDLAQPQHTRNDAHYVGAELEAYCDTHYGTPGQISALPSEAIPSFSGTTSPIGGIPGEFAGFWDTGQYTGQANFAAFGSTPGLAEYSNAYFITDDTMFGTTRVAVLPRGGGAPALTVRLSSAIENWSTSAGHRYPHPHIRNTNVSSFYPPPTASVTLQREGVGLTGAVVYADLIVRNPGGAVVHTTPNLFLINADNEIGFDDVTQESTAQMVLPKAVSYAAGVVNYFFRAKIGLSDPTTSWNAGEDKNQIEIRNDSDEAFAEGTWELYYDDANGNRALVSGFDASAYSGLGVGASFTAKFPEMLCDGGYEFTLVFKGKIGNELDAVAGRTFYTAPEIWVGTYNVPSGDPNCIAVSGECIAIFERPTPPGYDIVGYLQMVGASDLFAVSGTCNNDQLIFGNGGECGYLLSGTISGASLTNGQTCCWYCPLNPPPEGPWFCGTIDGMERTQ